MSTLGTITTTIKNGTGKEATYDTIICAMYECKQTSIAMPYRLIKRLDTDSDFVDEIAHTIISGGTLNMNVLLAADSAITLDSDYLHARERETPELVMYDKKGNIRARRTTPAAFIRRFVIPAIETALDAAVVIALGLNTDGITAEHLHNIVKAAATTEVTDKVKHMTKGTSNADKRAAMSRRARRAAHK